MSKQIYLQGYGQKWSLGNDFENYRNFFPTYGLKVSKNIIPFNKIVYLSNKYRCSLLLKYKIIFYLLNYYNINKFKKVVFHFLTFPLIKFLLDS